MAQLIDDFDKKDNTTAPTDSSHGALKDDFGDTSAPSDKPSLWQRAKSLFTSKPKTMTVQPDESIPDKEPPRKGSDLRELYDQDPVMQGKGTPKQMTVTPEQDGILTRAAKSIQKHLGAQTNEGLVGIHDKELSFRQGSASDFYPEISAGTKESVNKLQEGEKTLATSKQKLEAWLPPPELKATSAKINTIKKQLDDISVHAVDNKLPSDLYKKYTTLRDQHKAEVKKYNDLLKNTKGDYQAQVAEYTKQVNEFNARKLRLSIATPDEEEKPSLIQHIARSVGVDKALGMDKETSIKRREDIENAQAAVELTGGKQEDDETLMQLIKFAGNESALGLPKAILEAQGEKWEEPKTTQEKVAAGAGTLIGFIYGAPGKITNLVEKGVVNLYPKLILRGTDSALIKGAKEAAYKLSGSVAVQNTVGLAAGFSSAAIGEALSKDNVDDAFKVLVKAAGFGAVMGGTFAGVKGAIPGEAPLDKIKRIATGLAIFDLERGNQPFDERKLNDKIMDYGMDAYFLWHGLPNQERGLIVDSMDDILTKLNNKTDLSNEEVRKIWKNNPEKRKELLKKYAGVKEQPIVDDFEPETTKEAQNAIKEGEKINQPEHTGINGELQQDGQNRNVGAGKQGEGAEAGDSNKPIPSKKKEVRPATEIIDDLDKVAPEEAVSKGNEVKAEEKPEEKPIIPPEEKKAAEAKPEAKPVAKEPIWDEEEWRKQDRRRTQIAIDMLGKEDQRTATEDRRKPEPAAKVEGTLKQPWEMTQLETAKKINPDATGLGAPGIAQHKVEIKAAIARGETIPPEVLKDYPDLQKAPESNLIEESRKYKTAEEFVKANTYYRGQDYQGELGNFFTTNKKDAQQYATKVHEIQVAPEDIYKPDVIPKATSSQIDNAIGEAERKGFKAMWVDESKVTGSPQGELSLFVFDKKGIKTKKQLASEWNQTQEMKGDYNGKENKGFGKTGKETNTGNKNIKESIGTPPEKSSMAPNKSLLGNKAQEGKGKGLSAEMKPKKDTLLNKEPPGDSVDEAQKALDEASQAAISARDKYNKFNKISKNPATQLKYDEEKRSLAKAAKAAEDKQESARNELYLAKLSERDKKLPNEKRTVNNEPVVLDKHQYRMGKKSANDLINDKGIEYTKNYLQSKQEFLYSANDKVKSHWKAYADVIKDYKPAEVTPEQQLAETLKYRSNEIKSLTKKASEARSKGQDEVANIIDNQRKFYENIDIDDYSKHFRKNPKYYTDSNIDPFLRYDNRKINLAGSDFPMIDDIREVYPVKDLSAEPKKAEATKVITPTKTEEQNITSPKEQKKYLLSAIDEALKVAPEGEAIPKATRYEKNKLQTRKQIDEDQVAFAEKRKEVGTVRIEVPNDGTFEILNTRQALEEFKKQAKAFPSSAVTEATDIKPTTPKPTAGKRIAQEEVQYYNDFKPRKEGILTDNSKEVSEDGTSTARNFYDDKIGWYTDGHYAIKTEKPTGVKLKTAPDVTRVIPKDNNIEAKIVGEFHYGLGDADREPAKVHMIGSNGKEQVFDAKFVDSVLTKYPNAKPFMRDEGGQISPVLFKDKGKDVAVVMPLKDDGQVNNWFGDRIAELTEQVTPKNADMFAEKAPEVKAKKPLNPTNQESTTADSGEELTYNKRNRIRTGIKWEDIADKNTALKVKETTKQNVYPKPDYQQMIDGGVEPVIAHIAKQVYDSISVKPVTRNEVTDDDMKLYISAVNRVMDGVVTWTKDKDAIASWATKQAKVAGAMLGKPTSITDIAGENKTLLDIIYPTGWKEYRPEVLLLGGNKLLGALQPGRDATMKAMKEAKAGWPEKQESWQKQGLKIIDGNILSSDFYSGKTYPTDEPYTMAYLRFSDGSRNITIKEKTFNGIESKDDPAVQEYIKQQLKELKDKHILLDKHHRLIGSYDSLELAQDAARENVKRENKPTISEKGISVEDADRTGIARRLDGEDISSDRLRDTFEFKGVNFGNWMKGDTNEAERQLHLNHAYDSFMDLAEILNVPPKAMSLNGMLGIAIGAQGTGKYAAHFVPGVNEINLTRTSGAGSLAHEFGHAIDHYFARQAGLEGKGDPYLTEHVDLGVDSEGYTKREGKKVKAFGEGIRPEITALFRKTVRAMNERPQTPKELAESQSGRLEKSKTQLGKWLKSTRDNFTDKDAFDKLVARINNADYGEGAVAVSKYSSIKPVLAEMRELYKKQTGHLYDLKNTEAINSWLTSVEYQTNNKDAVEDHIPQNVATDYAKEALKLDSGKSGKRYWSTNVEKFARAFDAYVSDTLEKNAAKNTYLSHAGISGETVPHGKERETINNAFNDLIKEIKTKETDKGTIELYSGIDPTQTLKVLRGLKDNIAEAMPHLEALGRAAYEQGKQKYEDWQSDMKSKLGDLWDSFKQLMKDIWNKIAKYFKDQTGAVGRDIRMKWGEVDGLTEEQKEARSRIERDVKILSVNAKEEGKTLAEYLKDIGLDDARAKRLLDYAKVQPVEYPGYKEVGEGEALEPGADVIMDMATGKNFVKIPETTGIKKAVKTAEREARGLEEVESEVKRVIPSFEEGKRLVDSEERDPRLLAESIAGGERKGMLEDQEVAMLLYDAMRISNDITDVNDALEEAILDGDKVKECELRLQHAKLLEDLNTNDIAVKRGGTEWSAVGRMYQQIIKEDYSLAKTLQRARIEYGDKLPREIEDKITELTRQLEDAQKKLKEYDEKAAVEAAKKEIQRIKSEPVIRQYIYKAKERQAETKDEILAERERIISAFNKTLSQLHFMFDPTAVKYLAEWTRNLVKDGLNTVEDITDEIYRVTEANHPELGITKRDIRDAISGYGRTFELSRKEIDVQLREIKRQARLISAYEDALSKQVPLRSGMQRDPLSDKVRGMGRQVRQAMREAGIDSLSTRTPEEQWKTSLDAVKTRLKNQIADLTKQLETGKKTPKKIGIEYDEEANALKEERDSLSAALAEIEGKPQMSPDQKIKMAMAAVEKSIAEYDRRIKENDLTPQKKVSTTPVTPELKAMREKRDQLKEIYKGMQDEAKPKLTPEQVYTNHLEKRKTDLEEKLRTKNFAKKPRRTYNLDERGLRLKGDIEGLKRQINIQIKRIELENRPKFEKDLDLTVRARRAVIFTSSTIFLKLSAAATARFVLEPIRNIIIGGTLYHVPGLKTLMRESPTEGGGYMTNIRAERARLARLINKNTWIDSWDMLTKGYNTLSVLDKGEQAQVRDWLDIPAHAHGAIKEPVKQGGYFAARVKYTQYCLENNLDPTNPVIEQMINAASMFYAKRQIFMNDNIVNDLYKSGLQMVERKGIGGKVATTFVRVELPVTKVPSNIFLEVGDMAVGLPKGLSQTLYHMLKSGAWEKLNPDQKDNIARSLKNGLLGLAIFGIAFYLFKNGDKPVRAGGFYRQGAKRKITDPQPDELRIGDVNIPKPLLHNTALITFQAAWTLFTVQEQYEKEMKAGGTWAGTAAAVMGLGQTLPFLDEPARMAKAMKNQDTAAKMAAEQLRGLVLPPDVPRIAKMIDTDVAGQPVARKPETAGDVFKMAIPGLRQQVPENTKKEKTDLKAKLIDDLRNDEPDAKENLDEAKSEGQITKTEKKEIKKEAKEDPFIATMKHLSLQEMAKRIGKNATPEQKEALYPVFKKKFFKERKDLDDDTKQKYLDLLDDMR